MTKGRKLALGGMVGAASLLACLNLAECGDDDAPETDTGTEGEPAEAGATDPRGKNLPVDISLTENRAQVDAALCSGESLVKAKAAQALVETVGNTDLVGQVPTAVSSMCSAKAISRDGELLFGYLQSQANADNTGIVHQAVLGPDFFSLRNDGCRQATALYALSLCTEGQGRNCDAYNGPQSPYLPHAVQNKAQRFLQICEGVEAGTVSPAGQIFEGTESDGLYTGTVTYKNGAKAEGTFAKDAKGEFYPTGDYKITWADGGTLAGSVDWANDTEEKAVYTEGDTKIEYAGDPENSDFTWILSTDHTNLTNVRYTVDWQTMETSDETVPDDPEGKTLHIITDAELASYTGYGRYTNFDPATKFAAYEGSWDQGKFEGTGTLRNVHGQIMKDGTWTAGDLNKKKPLEFQASTGAPALKLIPLQTQDGWIEQSEIEPVQTGAKKKWTRYVWNSTEKKMEALQMVIEGY